MSWQLHANSKDVSNQIEQKCKANMIHSSRDGHQHPHFPVQLSIQWMWQRQNRGPTPKHVTPRGSSGTATVRYRRTPSGPLTGQSWFNGKQGEGARASVFRTLMRHSSWRACLSVGTRLHVKHKLKTALSVCCRAALTWLSMTLSSLTHQPLRFNAQMCRNHNSRRAPSQPASLPASLPPSFSVSGSLVAEEAAYLCSCQSAASSSAGAPASPALLSPSPAWLSWSSPPSPSSCGSPSLLPDEAHTFAHAGKNQNPTHEATTLLASVTTV